MLIPSERRSCSGYCDQTILRSSKGFEAFCSSLFIFPLFFSGMFVLHSLLLGVSFPSGFTSSVLRGVWSFLTVHRVHCSVLIELRCLEVVVKSGDY